MEKLNKTLKSAEKLGDRKLARELRLDMLSFIAKTAQTQQTGIFQVFRDNSATYPTRQNVQVERGGDGTRHEYDTGPKHPKMNSKREQVSGTLSTRYSPDHVGVQVRRLADGVVQDPYTNKIYDWNSGFKTESGEEVPGGGVALQTDLTPRNY